MPAAGPTSPAASPGQPAARRAPSLSRRKRILFTLCALALALVFIEVSLQLFYRVANGNWLWNWWTIPIYAPDPIRVYGLKANLDYWHKTSEFSAHYLTDAAGMRTDGRQPAPAIPKPPGRFRILALGPSFAFGWGVNYEDAYMYRIASGLKIPGKQVELVNLGTPSQPGCYQLKWLREAGYKYEPDLIVQTVYGDVERIDSDDSLPDIRPKVVNGFLYPGEKMTLSMRIRWLRRYSAILFYGWHFYTTLSSSRTAGDGRELYKQADPPDGPTLADEVKSYSSYLEFVHHAVSNQPPVVFIHVPLSWVVRPADISRVAHHPGALNPFAMRERIALLTSALCSNQVNFIDTTPVLVQHDSQTRMYNFYDIHFTVSGNKVVAEHVLPLIQEILAHPGTIAPPTVP